MRIFLSPSLLNVTHCDTHDPAAEGEDGILNDHCQGAVALLVDIANQPGVRIK
jgi:hypothetical protein